MARGKNVSAVDPAHMPHSDQFRLNRPSLWEAMPGMLAVGILHAFLPAKLLLGPAWLLLAVEAVFLLPIILTLLTERGLPYKMFHPLLLALLSVLTLGLASGIVLLIITVVGNKHATILLRAALLLWGSIVLIFGLWYWQIDGGGPEKRHQSGSQAADFLFPQQENGNPTGWIPCFLDYLFLAFTPVNAILIEAHAQFVWCLKSLLW